MIYFPFVVLPIVVYFDTSRRAKSRKNNRYNEIHYTKSRAFNEKERTCNYSNRCNY